MFYIFPANWAQAESLMTRRTKANTTHIAKSFGQKLFLMHLVSYDFLLLGDHQFQVQYWGERSALFSVLLSDLKYTQIM